MTAEQRERAMWTSPAAYVRERYGVPAKRFGRVVVDGRPGMITGFVGGYIRVRFDGEQRSDRCHPTWRVEYLPETSAEQRERAGWTA